MDTQQLRNEASCAMDTSHSQYSSSAFAAGVMSASSSMAVHDEDVVAPIITMPIAPMLSAINRGQKK